MISLNRIGLLLLLAGLLLQPSHSKAQEFGVSFSFFMPRNGYFSTPVSPLSLRGIGFDLNRFVSIETGFTLYRIPGMNVTGMPFDSKEPIMGPFFSFLVPLDLVLTFGSQSNYFSLKGGGFTYINFDNRVNYGNLDRALVDFTGLEVVNSQVQFQNNLGLGYHFGAEYTFYVNQQFGLAFGAEYFVGGSKLAFVGSYTGASTAGGLESQPIDYPDSRLDFAGLELSISVIFSP